MRKGRKEGEASTVRGRPIDHLRWKHKLIASLGLMVVLKVR